MCRSLIPLRKGDETMSFANSCGFISCTKKAAVRIVGQYLDRIILIAFAYTHSACLLSGRLRWDVHSTNQLASRIVAATIMALWKRNFFRSFLAASHRTQKEVQWTLRTMSKVTFSLVTPA